MTRYIALLRGINISGKHKISMTELKKDFENIGFTEIKTYLNSGNVIFSSNKTDKENITRQLETMLKDHFDFDIPIAVIPKEQLIDILHNAPEWWGNEDKEIYDNLIFIIPPTTFTDIFNKIGEPKHELEKIKNYKNAIFWSFSRKDYQKTNWWPKTANASIRNSLTIRTANTVKKIAAM